MVRQISEVQNNHGESYTDTAAVKRASSSHRGSQMKLSYVLDLRRQKESKKATVISFAKENTRKEKATQRAVGIYKGPPGGFN